MTDIGIKTVIPRAGMKARLFEAVLSKKDVVAQWVMDTKNYSVTGKLSDGGADWDAGGKLEGDFTFLGGSPTVTG